MLPGMELLNCQGLAVPMDVMQHIVRVESSFNLYAIGVVGGRLQRQPANLEEALSTVRMLEEKGYNFSLGLAQVNRHNLSKYGLPSYEAAFQPCPNLLAGSRILAECHARTGGDWGKSFSCYYSGNTTTGFRHGYVQRVFASMHGTSEPGKAIRVLGKPSPTTSPKKRYPLRTEADRTSRLATATTASRASDYTPDAAAAPGAAAQIQSAPAPYHDGEAVHPDRTFVF